MSRKHVREIIAAGAEAIEEMLKEPNTLIARVLEMRGAHCEVEGPKLEKFLVILPAKFRQVIWVKRGNYIVVRMGDMPNDSRFKLRGSALHILTSEQVSEMKNSKYWPSLFNEKDESQSQPIPQAPSSSSSSSKQQQQQQEEEEEESCSQKDQQEDDKDLFAGGNPNRRQMDEEDEDESD